jgi:parvulin-like peptidyl-prolyl isomerase
MRAWHRLGRGLLPAVVILALAGCANAEPGVVAYVGDTRITQGQLDRAVAGVSATLEPGQQISRDAVVNVMIHGVLAEQIAADRNISVTDSERETLIKNTELADLLAVPDAKPIAFDVADQQIVAQRMGAEAYLNAVRERPVTLNPRFGVLDPAQKLILGDRTGSLAKPVPAPTP